MLKLRAECRLTSLARITNRQRTKRRFLSPTDVVLTLRAGNVKRRPDNRRLLPSDETRQFILVATDLPPICGYRCADDGIRYLTRRFPFRLLTAVPCSMISSPMTPDGH